MSHTTDKILSDTITRRAAVLTFALGGSALVSACAARAPTPTSAPTKPPAAPTPVPTTAAQPAATAAAKPSPAPSPAPKPTQAPVKPQIAKVAIAQPGATLGFAPLYLARARKLFEDEMLDAEIQYMQNDPPAIASLVAGDSHFVGTGSNYQFQSHEKDLGFLTVAGYATSLKLEIVARKDFLQRKGATPEQPLQQKMSALKGGRLGVSSLSGTIAQYASYALKVNGVNPESDLELIAVPSGPPRIAAIREGQIDASISSPPEPEIVEAEGVGTVFAKLGDELPVFKTIVYMGLFGRRSWIEQNTSITERVCRMIGRANNIILNDLPAAKEALKSAFPQVDPPIMDISLERMKTAFGPDARMTEEMWKNAAEVYLAVGLVKSVPPLAEGTLWTNKYLVNVPKR